MTEPRHHLLLKFMMAALCAAILGTPSFAQTSQYDVPFLTLRNVATQEDGGVFFGEGRSNLRAGRCIAADVDTGSLAPILDAGPTFIREQLLRIDSVDVQLPDALLTDVQAGQAAPLALYVHGYFIDFEKGCRRAALVQRNAKLDGRMVWFSWPSDGDVLNYDRDESDLYWSVPDIADAIIDLQQRSPGSAGIDVIGHSLGGRGVALALQQVAYRAPDIRLGNVVLLAADMDFAIFARALPLIAPIAKSITVYVSDEDRPLALSEQLHGYARLGQAGNDVAALDGVELIDVSRIPNESGSGHLYHIHNAEVGRDLDRLLNDGLRASERANLRQTGVNTWELIED